MKRRQFLQRFALGPALLTTQSFHPLPVVQNSRIVLKNPAGLRWELERTPMGWALGQIFLNQQPVGDPVRSGMMCLRKMRTGEERWLLASTGTQVNGRKAHLEGRNQVDGIWFEFQVDIELAEELTAVDIRTRWSLSNDLEDSEVCLVFQSTDSKEWRCAMYPFAGNSVALERQRLNSIGVPAALLFRKDFSLAALFGINPASDYLNPTTWTAATGFHYRNRDISPQYRVGGGKLLGNRTYEFPLQLVLSDAGDSMSAIKFLVHSWITFNHYKVDPLFVRTPEEALKVFIDGRRATSPGAIDG